MKVYFNYEREELMTEQEARKYLKEDILNDDYDIWEFISNNYCCDEVMENLPQDFLENAKEEISDDDDYDLWDFISDNYFYEEIIKNLSQGFLRNATEELIKNRLENPDYFLVREFPD